MIDNSAAIYWEGCAAGEIRFQMCEDCSGKLSYPRSFCPTCGSTKVGWHRSAGDGVVIAKTVVARAPSATFEAITPYALLLVSLDEGPTIMAHGELALEIGRPVTADFREVGGRHLPYFKSKPLVS